MGLYLKYLSMHIKAALEYKKAFIISIFSKMATSLFSVIAILFLFDKFGNVDGYTFENVLICFSISYLGYSTAECFFRAFDHFDRIIGNGTFDRMLVRPRNLVLQVLGNEIEFDRIGRTLIAFIIFVIVLIRQPELLKPDKIFTLILMIIGTIIIYAALFVLKAWITFFTTQGLEVMNIFTDGVRDLAEYPLSIYQKWVQNFFTYILPIALVNYFPLLYVIERTDNKFYIILPILSVLFVIPCYAVWKIGLRKYKSTGSWYIE